MRVEAEPFILGAIICSLCIGYIFDPQFGWLIFGLFCLFASFLEIKK